MVPFVSVSKKMMMPLFWLRLLGHTYWSSNTCMIIQFPNYQEPFPGNLTVEKVQTE